MTITLAWYAPYAIAALSALIGFLAATFAYLTSPRPGQEPVPPLVPELRSPLPRPGYLILQPVEQVYPGQLFPTEPMSLLSEHSAQMARTELEIRQLIDGYGG